MKKILLTTVLICMISALSAQNYFRSGIFLHHSTGSYIWGPNPDGTSTTTIPGQMHGFNTTHGFNGNDSVTMNAEWWSPGDNEWCTQHEFFEGNTAFTDINYYLENNKILVIKSCFPSSAMAAVGGPSDTLNPTYKSIYNYKWHWRHIVKVMENHPDRFFAIWTNAPLENSSTTITEAGFSKAFCRWAKDTLANGLDTEYGPFPANVYVFDFFGKLTGTNGIMLDQYRTSAYDSHPNGAATDLVAPQFVDEIFEAALAYESLYANVEEGSLVVSGIKIFPNPATDVLNIGFHSPAKTIILEIFSTFGEKLFLKIIPNGLPNQHLESVDLSGFATGYYLLRIQTENAIETKKFVIQK
jgi:hypothetical protein